MHFRDGKCYPKASLKWLYQRVSEVHLRMLANSMRLSPRLRMWLGLALNEEPATNNSAPLLNLPRPSDDIAAKKDGARDARALKAMAFLQSQEQRIKACGIRESFGA